MKTLRTPFFLGSFIFFCCLVFTKNALAAEIFDFKVSKDLSVQFSSKLPPNLASHIFLVRPVSDKNLRILNKESGTWIDVKSLWSSMPYLDKELKNDLKLKTSESSFTVFFLIQDLKSSLIYKTPTRKVWVKTQFNDYIERLNKSILLWIPVPR